MKSIYALIAVAFALLGTVQIHADTIVETYSHWDNSTTAGNWGNPAFTPTMGQTFTVPTDGNSNLTSFTVSAKASFGASLKYQTFIYAWDGSQITGTALYTGPELTLTSTSFTPLETDTGGLNLDPGSQYVIFYTLLTTTGSSGSGGFALVFPSNDYYGGGQHVQNTASSSGNLGSTSWSNFSGGDLAFSATFAAPTPEPSTWALLLVGLAFAGFCLRRKTA